MSTEHDTYIAAYGGEADNPLRQPAVHDGLSITAFVLAFFFPLAGFILGCVAISAAHKQGRKASGLALAAAWVSGVFVVIITVLVIVVIAAAAHSTGTVTPADPWQQYLNCVNAAADPTTCVAPG